MTDTLAPKALIGHLEVEQEIRALFAEDRLPHALILHGPKGVGKRLLAERLAWHIICGQGANPEPGLGHNLSAPQAPQLLAGAYPYFHVLSPDERLIKIDAVREKINTLSLTADGWRVVIIDSADDLNGNAANALLKTLEEPNSKTLLVLISHNPSKLLPTLISRCRQYRLSPLTQDQVTTVLTEHGIQDPEERQMLAALAGGCPGEAIQLRNSAPQIQTLLSKFFTGTLNQQGHVLALSTAEGLADKKLSAHSGALLLWWLATCSRAAAGQDVTSLPVAYQPVIKDLASHLPAHAWARLHGSLSHRLTVQQTVNLPLQLTLENALQDVVTSVQHSA